MISRFTAVLPVVMVLAACSSSPPEARQARQALLDARAQGAALYAPEEMALAQQKLREQSAAQEGGWDELSRQRAHEAMITAQLAQTRTQAEKAKLQPPTQAAQAQPAEPAISMEEMRRMMSSPDVMEHRRLMQERMQQQGMTPQQMMREQMSQSRATPLPMPPIPHSGQERIYGGIPYQSSELPPTVPPSARPLTAESVDEAERQIGIQGPTPPLHC